MKFSLRRNLRSVGSGVLGALLGAGGMFAAVFWHIPSRPVIAFIPRTTGTSFTETMRHGAEDAAEKAGYQIYWNGPTRADDVERQIRIADEAVSRGAVGLILAPTNPWGVTTMIDSLTRRKLPIVVVQTEAPIPHAAYITSVSPKQPEFGQIAAKRINEITSGVGQVAIIGVNRGEPETLARAQSFVQALRSYPRIKVVAQSSGSLQTLEMEQDTRAILDSFPDLKAFFAVSADASEAASHVLRGQILNQKVLLIGCDRDLFLTEDLHNGAIDSVVTSDAYRMGYLAVIAEVRGIRNHSLPPPIYIDASLLNREGLEKEDHQTNMTNAGDVR